MKVLVLAGGLGTRLRPRLGDLPKGLAPIGGRPFLTRQLEWLAGHGLRDVVLCVGVGADQIEDALGSGAELGIRLTYSREPRPLGTAGALARARDLVSGSFVVVNGDTFPEVDPLELERGRWERGRIAAVALFHVGDASASGRVELDDEDRVARFVEKDGAHRGPAWVNGGCYAFDARIWDWIEDGPHSLERDVLPRLASRGEVHGFRASGSFVDIGTPQGWEAAEARFAR